MDLTGDISKLKVPELKKELKQRGLNTSGNKNELVERLQDALKSPCLSTEISGGSLESDILEDLFLNDDEDDHQNVTDTTLDSDVLEESPDYKDHDFVKENSNGIQRKAKRLKLQRDIPTIDETFAKSKSDQSITSEESSPGSEPKPKVIKLSGISVKERLELRAKKFGVELTGSAKLLARAERFGSLENESKLSEIEKLKKRAERFGGSVAKEMTSLEMKEKMEARKARFAISK